MGCRSQILALTPIIDSEPCIAALTPVRVPLLLLLPGDLSTNNWLWVIFAAGEGWHHNHHAFCYSARMGFEVGLSGCWVHQSVGSLVLAFRCSVFRFWQWWWIPRGSAATSTCFVC